jgi:DNA-binding SARP family transcriptional activator
VAQDDNSLGVEDYKTPTVSLGKSWISCNPFDTPPAAILAVIIPQVSEQSLAILTFENLSKLVAAELGGHGRHQQDTNQADQGKSEHQFEC